MLSFVAPSLTRMSYHEAEREIVKTLVAPLYPG